MTTTTDASWLARVRLASIHVDPVVRTLFQEALTNPSRQDQADLVRRVYSRESAFWTHMTPCHDRLLEWCRARRVAGSDEFIRHEVWSHFLRRLSLDPQLWQKPNLELWRTWSDTVADVILAQDTLPPLEMPPLSGVPLASGMPPLSGVSPASGMPPLSGMPHLSGAHDLPTTDVASGGLRVTLNTHHRTPAEHPTHHFDSDDEDDQ